jgi:hypothetical protein
LYYVSLYVSNLHAHSGLLAHLAERSHVGPRSMPAQNPLKSERLVDKQARTGGKKKKSGEGTHHQESLSMYNYIYVSLVSALKRLSLVQCLVVC